MVWLCWHCTEIPFVASEKHFSVFLIFISAVDLFVGIVVCSAEALMRLRCAFGDNPPPTEGDFPIIVEYIGVNSSILLVTSMSVDRFVSVVCSHFYLLKVRPKHLVFCNVIIVVSSSIFASLQLVMCLWMFTFSRYSLTHTLIATTMAYSGIFLTLRKSRSRVDLQRQSSIPNNRVLRDIRRVKNFQKQHRSMCRDFVFNLILSDYLFDSLFRRYSYWSKLRLLPRAELAVDFKSNFRDISVRQFNNKSYFDYI